MCYVLRLEDSEDNGVYASGIATLIAILDPLCSVSDVEAAINNNEKAEQ